MGSQVIGKYELFDKIAAGGMAAVHLGRFRGEGGFSRTVALKRLHPQFAADPDFVAMFLDEARLASRIRHPNVVSTLDVVSNGGEVLLVMDYVVGESLAALMRAARPSPVPVRVAVAIMTSVLHGLHAAHEAKTAQGVPLEIVHRDVSPQNILVGSDGVARVLDFGIAKASERAHTTRDGKIKGKLAYMAPEQLGSHPLDRRSDVYGAAVVLWEALVGDRLFASETEAGVVTKVLHGEVHAPSSRRPGMPPELDAVVQRGLSRDMTVRFDTAREMAIALERCGVHAASISEVGEWVESLAGETLAKRAQRVEAIEKETDPGISSIVALPNAASVDVQLATELQLPAPQQTLALLPPTATEPGSGVSAKYVASTSVAPGPMSSAAPRSRLRGAALLLAVLLGTAGGVLVLASLRRRAEPAHVVASEPVPPPPPASSLAPPLPPPTVLFTSDAPPLPAPSAKPVHPTRPVVAPPPPAVKKPDCTVPYIVDSAGIRRLRQECL